jgi:uncharacterized protein YjbI with pentapeptide repeats
MDKAEKTKESWWERKTRIKHKWLTLLIFTEWLCERVSYLLERWAFLDILGHAGRLTILVAVIFYFAEAGNRRKAKHYQAWQVINSAHGTPTSGGRKDALQDLNKDNVSLMGIDVSMAYISELNLQNANLRDANFSGANLIYANLSGARLRHANFVGTDLMYAKLIGADLRYANLPEAFLVNVNFTKVNLRFANLSGGEVMQANFSEADLLDANFSGANLYGANFTKAYLRHANFSGARLERANFAGADLMYANLTEADLRLANLLDIKNWQEIKSVELANICDVNNPPDGFIEWAKENGAVSIEDVEEWKKLKLKKMEEKKKQEIENSREDQEKVR